MKTHNNKNKYSKAYLLNGSKCYHRIYKQWPGMFTQPVINITNQTYRVIAVIIIFSLILNLKNILNCK